MCARENPLMLSKKTRPELIFKFNLYSETRHTIAEINVLEEQIGFKSLMIKLVNINMKSIKFFL